MRRLLALSLWAAPTLLACAKEDPPPQYVDIAYQMRCLDCQPIASDYSAHDVTAIDGEGEFDVSCRTRGSKPALTFSVGHIDQKHESDSFQFRIVDASLTRGDPGGGCHVTVTEGNSTYEAPCTGGKPTAEKPCQLELKQADGVITGSILCRNIPNSLTPEIVRSLVKPGSDTAAKFELHGCESL
jgi:hypothetical protein